MSLRRNLTVLLLLARLAPGPATFAQEVGELRAREAELRETLANNQFQRPMVLESTGANGVLNGDVYAVVDHPYDVVGRALSRMDSWCDILMLTFNVKGCQTRASGRNGMLSMA